MSFFYPVDSQEIVIKDGQLITTGFTMENSAYSRKPKTSALLSLRFSTVWFIIQLSLLFPIPSAAEPFRRSENICGNYNGRRIFIHLNEEGYVVARNITLPKNYVSKYFQAFFFLMKMVRFSLENKLGAVKGVCFH